MRRCGLHPPRFAGRHPSPVRHRRRRLPRHLARLRGRARLGLRGAHRHHRPRADRHDRPGDRRGACPACCRSWTSCRRSIAIRQSLVDPAGPLQPDPAVGRDHGSANRARGGSRSASLLADDKMVSGCPGQRWPLRRSRYGACQRPDGRAGEDLQGCAPARILQRTDGILASLQVVARNLAAASPKFGQVTSSVASTTESMPGAAAADRDDGPRTRAAARPVAPELAAGRHGGAPGRPARAAGEVRP